MNLKLKVIEYQSLFQSTIDRMRIGGITVEPLSAISI